jgi:hypothetical protein
MRGLSNPGASYNCFLNAALQALYNLDVARTHFANPAAPRGDLLAEEIRALFHRLADEQTEPSLSPDDIRLLLSDIYKAEGRFKLNEMEDAVEAFEAILLSIHGGDIDKPCANVPCFAHDTFGFDSQEVTRCLSPDCRARAVLPVTREFLLRVHTKELHELTPAPTNLASGAGQVGRRQKCRSCGSLAVKEKWLLKAPPRVFVVQLVWPSVDPGPVDKREMITRLLRKTVVDFHAAFCVAPETPSLEYVLRGFIAYYGAHFVYLGLNRNGTWTLYDDALVVLVGTWFRVEDMLLQGAWKPVMLCFA